MDFQWIAIALGDVAWISVAFVLGLVSRSIGLPPLVGFLVTGFLLNAYGIASGEMLQKLSDLGITLLLFTVGLKLNLRTLIKPQVWAVTGLHTAIVVTSFGTLIYVLAILGTPLLSSLNMPQAFLIAFALSFSSTVFVVKALEDRGEMASLHGRIAIGILIVQDVAAVAFLAISAGVWPSVWAPLILLLWPLRIVFHIILERVGHGELMVLYGFLLAMGGAELFELLQLKGDLGALILGVLIASHPKADEMAKTMLWFKDLFLLGFFLSIGLSGELTAETLILGTLIAPFVLFKSAAFFALLTAFGLRARTSLLASINLTNFSEFGLIVASVGVVNNWIDASWLIVIAIALSLSMALSAVLSTFSQKVYMHHRPTWKRLQRRRLISDDRLFDTKDATIAVIGMGGVGTGAYDTMRELYGDTVMGVDIDPITARNQRETGRYVLHGDPTDADFWDRMQAKHQLDLILLALPRLSTNLAVVEQLKAVSFGGRIAATAKFQDEVERLETAGAHTVFDLYKEAGAGFASHVVGQKAGE